MQKGKLASRAVMPLMAQQLVAIAITMFFLLTDYGEDAMRKFRTAKTFDIFFRFASVSLSKALKHLYVGVFVEAETGLDGGSVGAPWR